MISSMNEQTVDVKQAVCEQKPDSPQIKNW